jgi:hypothetical protein
VTTLQNKITMLEKQRDQLLNAQIDVDLEKYSDRITDETKPKWKAALLANRETAIELLEGIKPSEKAPAKPQALTNTQPPKTPGAAAVTQDDAAAAKKAAAIRNRASEIQKTEGINFGQAFRRAEAELGKE